MKLTRRSSSVTPSLTLEITAKAKKMKSEGIDVISFGAGEPDFNTPEFINDAAKKALDMGLTKYTPASGTLSLKQAVADKLKRENGLDYKPADIVISNGAKHCLYNAFQAVVEEGDEVIIPSPYWLTYPELVKLCDGVPVYVETSAAGDFKITPEQLEKAITPKTTAVIINNPNNPTGAVYDARELKALAEVLRKYPDVWIISDEIYENLIYDGRKSVSIASFGEDIKARTIVVNGVSKTFSMTGWRIGYTASDASVAKAISGMQSHTTSNPNSIAQYATEAAFSDERGQRFVEEMLKEFSERRKLITDKLDKIKELPYINPQGAFYCMVSVKSCFGKTAARVKIDSALDFANALLESQNVAVIPCESFGAGDYIRLSYAISQRDIAEGIDRIGRFVKSL